MSGFVISNLSFAARPAFAEWLGTGRKDAFKNVNLAIDDVRKMGLELGQFFEFENTIYRAVRARSAITAAGYTMKTYSNAASRTGAAQNTSTKDKLVTTDTLVKGDLIGGRVWFTSGTDGGSRFILENNDAAAASVVTVAKRVSHLNRGATTAADAFTNQPDNTSNYNLHCDWEVTQTTAVTELVTCVALGAVTVDYCTIVAVAGPAVEIFLKGDVDAVTAMGLIVPSSTTGVSKGPTAAGLTATESAVHFAQAYDAYTGGGALRMCRLFGKFAIGGQRVMHRNN